MLLLTCVLDVYIEVIRVINLEGFEYALRKYTFYCFADST